MRGYSLAGLKAEEIWSQHVIELPKLVVIGSGVIDNLPEYLNRLGVKSCNVLLITGPRVWNVIGKSVKNTLEDSKFHVQVEKVKKSTVDLVEELVEEFKSEKLELIVGLGGGKSIDVAKFLAYELKVDFISVPTSASHDGIASPFASLKGFKRPISVKSREPLAVIADTRVVVEAPKKLNSSGFGDAVAKLTAVLDWRLAHKVKGEYYGDYAASLALLSANHVIKYSKEIGSKSEEGIRILLEALISSSIAMSIAGSTRPGSGSEHLFSHALDVVAPNRALHGEQCGVGTIMMSYLHGRDWRRIRRALREAGAPTSAKELGVREEDVLKALTIAHKIRPERYTILGERGLSWREAEKLAENTLVI